MHGATQKDEVGERWRGEVNKLLLLSDVTDIRKHLEGLTAKLGFESMVTWSASLSPADGRPLDIIDINTFSEGWQEVRNWSTNPALRDFCAEPSSVVHAPYHLDKVTEPDREFWEGCHSLGIRAGLGIGTKRPGGTLFVVGAARSAEEFTPSEIRHLVPRMQYLQNIAAGVMTPLLWPDRPLRNADLLTKRQIQILRFAAGGWNREETANAMNISAETVKSHRKNIIQILGARDMTHAVVIAVRDKIITPFDVL